MEKKPGFYINGKRMELITHKDNIEVKKYVEGKTAEQAKLEKGRKGMG